MLFSYVSKILKNNANNYTIKTKLFEIYIMVYKIKNNFGNKGIYKKIQKDMSGKKYNHKLNRCNKR